MKPWRAWVGIGAWVASGLVGNVAHAESYVEPCRFDWVAPGSGEIPRDQPAFVVEGDGTLSAAPNIVLVQTDADGERELEIEVTPRVGDAQGFVVVPTTTLVPGTSLELRGDVCREVEGYGGFSVIYRVVDRTAELPAPPLTLAAQVRGSASDGYFDGFTVRLEMEVEGGGELRAWPAVVSTELGLAGISGPGFVEGPRRAARSFALACEGFSGLPPGEHVARGSLALVTGEVLGSTEQAVPIACEDAIFFDAASGRELTPAQVARLRRRPEPRDAGARADAGSRDGGIFDAGWDSGPDDAGVDGGGDGGCATQDVDALGAGWMLALALVGLRRRRR